MDGLFPPNGKLASLPWHDPLARVENVRGGGFDNFATRGLQIRIDATASAVI
jgi:hypothetical protein